MNILKSLELPWGVLSNSGISGTFVKRSLQLFTLRWASEWKHVWRCSLASCVRCLQYIYHYTRPTSPCWNSVNFWFGLSLSNNTPFSLSHLVYFSHMNSFSLSLVLVSSLSGWVVCKCVSQFFCFHPGPSSDISFVRWACRYPWTLHNSASVSLSSKDPLWLDLFSIRPSLTLSSNFYSLTKVSVIFGHSLRHHIWLFI